MTFTRILRKQEGFPRDEHITTNPTPGDTMGWLMQLSSALWAVSTEHHRPTRRTGHTGRWKHQTIVLDRNAHPICPNSVSRIAGRSFHTDTTMTTTTLQMVSSPGADGDNGIFSKDIVQALDLTPLVDGISVHCGTRRGREALLSLVGHADVALLAHKEQLRKNTSSRKRRVLSGSIGDDVASPLIFAMEGTDPTGRDGRSRIEGLALSLEEARTEYELVEQAMLALSGHDGLSFPPIYGAESSPHDIDQAVDTDYDEWIWLPADELTLEHVMHAEQIVRTIRNVHEWSTQEATATWTPSLASICADLDNDVFEKLGEDLFGTVEVVRQSTVTDPNGRSVSSAMALQRPLPESVFVPSCRL